MKCVRIHRHGGPEQLLLEEVDPPGTKADEVLVRVKATSVNHIDIWVRKGMPNVRIPLPIIPGVDAAGTVAQCGAAVTHVKPEDRVVVAQGISCGHCARCLNGHDNLCNDYILIGEHRDGADAEFLAVPARNVIPLPDAISFESAAAGGLVFLTAWQMLVDKAAVRPGDDVLVMGASSGVGTAAIQIARLYGARVIAVTSTEAKGEKLRELGAHDIILRSRHNIVTETRRLTGNKGVEVVFEHVGQDVWDQCLRSMAKGGRLVTCGATSGYAASTDLRYVFYRQLQILGSTMGRKGDLVRILGFMAADKLHPVIDSVMPLSDVQKAHRRVEQGEHVGKVVLVP